MRFEQKTEAEIKEARAKAARDLVNIDEPERKRRVIFGSVLLVRALLHACAHHSSGSVE